MKSNTDDKLFFTPPWPCPPQVKAFSTLRGQRDNSCHYSGFNVSDTVNDEPSNVQSNRQYLQDTLQCPSSPYWLQQVHGTTITSLDSTKPVLQADSAITQTPGKVCVIMTADCLPILICNRQGTEVAAIHAGWRGLLAGIIDQTVQRLSSKPNDLLIWLGPTIGPQALELNASIKDQFIAANTSWQQGFHQIENNRWFADLQHIASIRLKELNITNIYTDTRCTFHHPDNFYSYRRDGAQTGRMAHLIWLAEPL